MNNILTEQIVKHILSNLGVINGSNIDGNKSQTLISKDFLLRNKLSFKMEDDSVISNKIWGCQLSIENKEMKIVLGDSSQDKNIKEHCLIIHLKDSPIYGLYIIPDVQNTQVLIACSLNGKEWMQCNIYLQATFLAGMEQIKDHIAAPQKCNEYDFEYKAMLSFIEFHSAIFEDNYEGEED